MMPREGSPRTPATLPVHATCLSAKSPPVDLQACSEPVIVPDLHPVSTSAQKAKSIATTRRLRVLRNITDISLADMYLFTPRVVSLFTNGWRGLARRPPRLPTARWRPLHRSQRYRRVRRR